MGKIDKPIPHTGKIPLNAITRDPSQKIKANPVFSFLHVCENNCLLSDWQGRELKELIDTFKKMESLPWDEIKKHRGLNFKPVDRYTKKLPPRVSLDVTVYEVKVCEKKRLFGYRADNIFRVLWFDKNHEVIPYHKQKT